MHACQPVNENLALALKHSRATQFSVPEKFLDPPARSTYSFSPANRNIIFHLLCFFSNTILSSCSNVFPSKMYTTSLVTLFDVAGLSQEAINRDRPFGSLLVVSRHTVIKVVPFLSM